MAERAGRAFGLRLPDALSGELRKVRPASATPGAFGAYHPAAAAGIALQVRHACSFAENY